MLVTLVKERSEYPGGTSLAQSAAKILYKNVFILKLSFFNTRVALY